MWNRETVGSFIESHCAKGSHPDRRVFFTPNRHADAGANNTSCKMKTTRILIPLCLLCAALLPAVAQAQFIFTTNSGAITITRYTGSGGDVTIPSMTNGWPVTSIGDYAFYNHSSLTSVTIPTNVTSIGSYAFCDCSGLTSVTIPNSVTNMGSGAFEECYGLTNLTIGTSVTSIGDSAFYDCSGLTSVTIPNSVTSIGSEAFFNCYGLTAAYFQGNAPPDNGYAFYNDSSATVYYLPGTTGWEATFGSCPTALWALPYPVILSGNTNLGVRNNQFGFTVSWATNVPVIVLAATNLANPVWTPVSTNALTNGTSYFSDSKWTNYPSRFSRLRSP